MAFLLQPLTGNAVTVRDIADTTQPLVVCDVSVLDARPDNKPSASPLDADSWQRPGFQLRVHVVRQLYS